VRLCLNELMHRVRHVSLRAIAATPAKGEAAAASGGASGVHMVDLRRGSTARAGTFVYDGPALATTWHVHAQHQLEYSTGGTLGVASRHAQYTCPPHQAIWIAAGTEHRTLLGRARTVSVFFAPELAPTLGTRGVRVLQATPLLREMVLYAPRFQIDRSCEDPVAESFFATMAALLPEWLESDGPWSLPVSDHPVVAAAMELTLARLTDITPRVVARAARVSERSLRRVFASEAGISWSTYLARARLLRAMTLLATTDKGVLQIAGEVGYESASALSRALRAWTGSTPSQYRTHVKRGTLRE
ncbi:MAG TPA: helix-turn-helix transcriptional regulator, partial [Polyangiales bacterium]|nr:helix-turn-helix transcriptional regulator [Polyangiales bacterium]